MNKARFLDNNFLTSTTLTITPSTQDSTNTFAKSLTGIRSQYWLTTGNFEVKATNNLLYINDGSNKTITLTVAAYSGVTLASHIQTQLNAASSGWTCTYSNYIFTIVRSSSATLRLSQTTSSAWNILGYLGATDRVGLSFEADQTRIHTSEHFTVDLKDLRAIKAVCLFGEVGEKFTPTSGATIRVMGDNLNNFESPAYSANLTISTDGAFLFFDESYRYWRVEIIDPSATEHQKISYIYLGDYFELSNTNVAKGFSKSFNDRTTITKSLNGTPYFDESLITNDFNLSINLMDKDNREDLEKVYAMMKQTTAWVLSINPDADISYAQDDWTKLVRFAAPIEFDHTYCQYMSAKVSVEEVV